MPLKCLLGHDWEYPGYVEEGSCRQNKHCKRCDETQFHRMMHVWVEAGYLNNHDCRCMTKCSRCGEVTTTVIHRQLHKEHMSTSGGESGDIQWTKYNCSFCGQAWDSDIA